MSNISPRETLDRAMSEVMDDVLLQGSMVEKAIEGAVSSLKAKDVEKARQIYDADRQINKKQFDIEETVITLIATQQPMARDLRFLAAILEVTTELERMGDYAKGIARITVKLGKEPFIKPLIDIPRMADVCVDLLHRALTALVERDAEAARAIPKDDDLVDQLYNQVYRELMTFMLADPSTIDQANHLLWVAHNLERVADRVTNVCERIVFVVTGEMLEMDRTDDEWFAEEPW